ncbi:MAG: undecaprenyl-phosphate glucose phosphotransferase [Candidatus Lambdaproteobacteria bacterium]|nr:undecaprenyl-phosphate glucose phosphotransferase [Candidatus Lambdaproteobacteria bacterium]
MLRRQYQIVLAATVVLDLLLILAAWNASYWMRFYAVNVPPAQMYILPRAAEHGLNAAGLDYGDVALLDLLLDKPYSNLFALRRAIAENLSPDKFALLDARLESLVRELPAIPPYAPYRKVNNFLIILSLIVFRLTGVYGGVPFQTLRREIAAAWKGGVAVIVVTMATSFFYRDFEYSRVHMVYFGLLALGLLALGRLTLRGVLAALRQRGYLLRSFVLVGDSALAARFYAQWQRHPNLGMRLLGLVTPGDTVETPALRDIPRLGPISALSDILTRTSAQLVVSALTMAQHDSVAALQQGLATHLVDHKIVPDLYSPTTLHAEPEKLGGIPLITVTQSPLEGWNLVVKRTIDVAGSLVALLLFSPLFLAIVLAMRLSSPGPVFYMQERMGWNGRNFNMLKFRSMRVDAEAQTGAVWASADDARSTLIGRLLRRTSLDELPQLINVLRGEMSLVGPRPERPVFIENFRTQIPHYMLRHKIKAGMTGWAQINGWRGNTSLEKRIEFDLFYISHWSIGFDFRILFLTLFKGFIHPNAY